MTLSLIVCSLRAQNGEEEQPSEEVRNIYTSSSREKSSPISCFCDDTCWLVIYCCLLTCAAIEIWTVHHTCRPARAPWRPIRYEDTFVDGLFWFSSRPPVSLLFIGVVLCPEWCKLSHNHYALRFIAWVNDISASLSPLPSPSPQTVCNCHWKQSISFILVPAWPTRVIMILIRLKQEDHDVTHAGGVEDFYLAQPPLVMVCKNNNRNNKMRVWHMKEFS